MQDRVESSSWRFCPQEWSMDDDDDVTTYNLTKRDFSKVNGAQKAWYILLYLRLNSFPQNLDNHIIDIRPQLNQHLHKAKKP